MFVKMAFCNIKSRMHDYLIYILTLVTLAAMMLSAFMLPVFPLLSSSETDVFMSNSLSSIIALTLLILMLYMNRFMVKRRSQEYAIYSLSGIPQKRICILFLTEHMLLGLFALGVGVFLGLLLFWIILTIMLATWGFRDIGFAILQTCLYFITAHVISLLITVLYIRRLNIKNLLDFHKNNEKSKINTTHLILLSVITVVAFGIYFFQISHFNPFTASTLMFTIGVILYGSYAAIFGWLSWYRNRRGDILYHGKRLFIVGQLLSKRKTMICMCSIISGCLLIAICSFVIGWIFVGNESVLLGEHDDIIMGFAQFYIAILFTVIVLSMIALQQIVDIREHIQKFVILKQLGMNADNRNRILFTQVFLNFTIPVLMAITLTFCSLLPLEQILDPFMNKKHFLSQGASVYLGIFFFLYMCYMIFTYISLKKIKYSSLLRSEVN